MKCDLCHKEADKIDYSKLTIKNITAIKIMDAKIKDKATVLNLTLCRKCSDKLQASLLAGDFPPQYPECNQDCDHECGSCDLIR